MIVNSDIAEIKIHHPLPGGVDHPPMRYIRTADNTVILMAGFDVIGVLTEEDQGHLAAWLSRRAGKEQQ